MRNVVVGSFMGFVLAAAFLAACGSGGGSGAESKPAVGGEFRWTGAGDVVDIASGLTISGNDTWTSVTVVDNAQPDARNQYAFFEIGGNLEAAAQTTVTLDVGLLPAPDGTRFATAPQWIGSIDVPTGNPRRATLFGLRLLPTRFRVALRMRGGAGVTARLSTFTLTPYNSIQL